MGNVPGSSAVGAGRKTEPRSGFGVCISSLQLGKLVGEVSVFSYHRCEASSVSTWPRIPSTATHEAILPLTSLGTEILGEQEQKIIENITNIKRIWF